MRAARQREEWRRHAQGDRTPDAVSTREESYPEKRHTFPKRGDVRSKARCNAACTKAGEGMSRQKKGPVAGLGGGRQAPTSSDQSMQPLLKAPWREKTRKMQAAMEQEGGKGPHAGRGGHGRAAAAADPAGRVL